jgi:predicted HTH domain antitoxin
MSMCHIVLEVPDETVVALRVPQEKAAEELRVAAAMKLYELGRLSAGAAAGLAGMAKPVFLSRLESYGISAFDMSKEELTAETPLA